MLRDNHQKKSNEKKSKSIKDRNLSKNIFKTKKLSIYAKSYNNNNLNLYQGINKNKNDSNLNLIIHKRNSRIEIDSNKALNIKNIRRNTLKLDNKKFSPHSIINKEIKFNNFNIENKENIFSGNDNIYNNNKKKIKSLDNKKDIKKNKDNKDSKLNKDKISNRENILKMDRKLNLKNVKRKEENNNKLELIKNQKNNNENSEEKKINITNNNSNENKNIIINQNKEIDQQKENKSKSIIDNINKKENLNINANTNDKIENKNNKENHNKNLENIIKEITISDNTIYENKINNNNVEIKEDKNITKIENNPQKEIPLLKLDEEKSDKSSNEKEEKEENSKEKFPILKLNCSDSSSTSKNNKNSQSSYSEYSESNYESDDGLEVKGELLIKNKKTTFLNNVKKCLFNKVINLKKDLNDANSNSNSITNTDEDLKFKSKINFQKKKTAEFSNNIYKINLKENISFTESEIIPKQIIKSSIITQAGLNDNKKKTNQDSYLILEKIFNLKLNIYGIFDGHGENGHLISNLVSKFLSQYFTSKKNYYIPKKNESDISDSESFSIKSEEISINDEAIEQLFLENNNFIENTINKVVEKSNECNFNIEFSGTTCTLLFILENKLICSNIGDSQCVLFNCSDEERWTHEIISVVHKPDDPKEKERILEMGGVIHPYYDENGIYEGPNRVYVKNKTYPGLSLSRSIGDLVGEEVGIISEPDIIIKNIDSTCKYIVMGSDGLWDMIKPYDANRIVNPFFNRGDPEGACKALLKRASKYWEKEGSDRDDISIIVIFIGKPNKSNL